VLFFPCARIVYSLSLPKCKPSVVGVLIFVFLIISRMHVRLSTLCVTASLCLLAQGIILFSISCMYLELCAHNIFVSYLLSLCLVHVLYVFLSLTPSHKKSSLRGSVTQTADMNKQGAEPPRPSLPPSGAQHYQGSNCAINLQPILLSHFVPLYNTDCSNTNINLTT